MRGATYGLDAGMFGWVDKAGLSVCTGCGPRQGVR